MKHAIAKCSQLSWHERAPGKGNALTQKARLQLHSVLQATYPADMYILSLAPPQQQVADAALLARWVLLHISYVKMLCPTHAHTHPTNQDTDTDTRARTHTRRRKHTQRTEVELNARQDKDVWQQL